LKEEHAAQLAAAWADGQREQQQAVAAAREDAQLQLLEAQQQWAQERQVLEQQHVDAMLQVRFAPVPAGGVHPTAMRSAANSVPCP
jgi:hypothetical protein